MLSYEENTHDAGINTRILGVDALTLTYLGIQNASKKWTMSIHNWNLTLSQLAIFFEGRLDGALDL